MTWQIWVKTCFCYRRSSWIVNIIIRHLFFVAVVVRNGGPKTGLQEKRDGLTRCAKGIQKGNE